MLTNLYIFANHWLLITGRLALTFRLVKNIIMSTEENIACTPGDLMAVKDALDALSGSWKLPILIVLFNGARRFKEISKEINGISDKMLSKELKDLEENLLVKRTVYETFPPKVEYDITDHTRTLKAVMTELMNWGK